MVANIVGMEFNTTTWLEFLAMLNVRYLTEQLRELRVREFSKLKQGDMTISEYEHKLIPLGRFALTMCSTE